MTPDPLLSVIDVTADHLMQLIPSATGLGIFIYGFLVLLKRADTQQAKNIALLAKQRDREEQRADDCAAALIALRAEFQQYQDEQQQRRHQLISEGQGHRMVAELYRRRLAEAGLPTEHDLD